MSTFDLNLRDKSLVQVTDANKALLQDTVSLKEDRREEVEDLAAQREAWLEIFADDLVD